MKEKIAAIFVTILFIIASKGCFSDYIKGGDKVAIANYEKMIADSLNTLASFEPEYKESTIKIAHIPIKSYEFDYKFSVDNSIHSGKVTLSSLPKEPFIKVYYLKTDPSFNSTNPKEALEKEKNKNKPKTNLFFGLFWGILALLGTIIIIVTFLMERVSITVKEVLIKDGEALKNAYQIKNLKKGQKKASIILDSETKDNINKMNKADATLFCCAKYSLSIEEANSLVDVVNSIK